MTVQEQRDALLDKVESMNSRSFPLLTAADLDALIAAVRAEGEVSVEDGERCAWWTRAWGERCDRVLTHPMHHHPDCAEGEHEPATWCHPFTSPDPDADRLRALEAALRNLLDNAESVLVGDDEDGEFYVQAMRNADITAARALLAGEEGR